MKPLLFFFLVALSAPVAIAQDSGAGAYAPLDTLPVIGGNIPLAPGEEIIGIYAVPSIIKVPEAAPPVYTAPATAEIDRVTGLPRNAAGWTGTNAPPAGIGCFPQGVCAHLN